MNEKLSNLPLWPFLLLAAAQLGAFVYFTKQDSPWRMVGVGIAIVIMIFTLIVGVTRDKARP
jgi:membrane protein YdbS with pleckstrin-like domain